MSEAHDGYDDELLLAEADDDIVKARPQAAGATPSRSGAGLPWVLVAILVGIIIGMVWMIGRPAPAEDPTDSAPTASATTRDPQADMAELEALLATEPDNAQAHVLLGNILWQIGEDDEAAREHWEKGVELDPTLVSGWYALGFYYLYRNPPDMVQAQANWDKVLELDPNSLEAQNVLNHQGALGLGTPSATPSGG